MATRKPEMPRRHLRITLTCAFIGSIVLGLTPTVTLAQPVLAGASPMHAKTYTKQAEEQFWKYIKKKNKLRNSEKFLTLRLGKATCNALRDGATLEDLAFAVGPDVLLQDRKGIRVIAAAGRFLCPDQSSKFR